MVIISSAKAFTLMSLSSYPSSTSKSLTYKSNRMGEIKDPYGVPALKLTCSEPNCSLMLEKMSLMMLRVSSSIPASVHFSKSLWWFTLLNADLKSMKIA